MAVTSMIKPRITRLRRTSSTNTLLWVLQVEYGHKVRPLPRRAGRLLLGEELPLWIRRFQILPGKRGWTGSCTSYDARTIACSGWMSAKGRSSESHRIDFRSRTHPGASTPPKDWRERLSDSNKASSTSRSVCSRSHKTYWAIVSASLKGGGYGFAC